MMKKRILIFLMTAFLYINIVGKVDCQRRRRPNTRRHVSFDSKRDKGSFSWADYPSPRSSDFSKDDHTSDQELDPLGSDYWTPHDDSSEENSESVSYDYWRDDEQTNFDNSVPSDDQTYDYSLNIRNSGQTDNWRQEKLSDSEHSTQDEISNFHWLSTQRSDASNYHRTQPRNNSRRRHSSPTTRYARRGDRSYNRRNNRRSSNSNRRPPYQRHGVERLMKQLVDPSLFEAYKQFYNKTLASCENGTMYVCQFDPTVDKIVGYLTCISLNKRCDGTPHCPLGDDEEGCPTPICKPLQVRCHEGTCATVCDGIPECKQLEDEVFCAPVCNDGHLRCPDGNCATVCDGTRDCKNGEDEMNCKDTISDIKVCKYGEVLCSDRKTCAKVCDGIAQCEDGADEQFVCG